MKETNQYPTFQIIFKSGKVSKFTGTQVPLQEFAGTQLTKESEELNELIRNQKEKLDDYLILTNGDKYFIIKLSEIQQIEISLNNQDDFCGEKMHE